MYVTTLSRAALAIAVGAAVGALIVVAVLVALPAYRYGDDLVARGQLSFIAFVAVAAFAVWAIGLTVIAIPCWRILHRRGWRDWRAAIVLGFVLTFVTYLALSTGFGLGFGSGYSAGDGGGMTVVNGRLTAHGWSRALAAAALQGAIGMVVGWMVWRVAYRRSAEFRSV